MRKCVCCVARSAPPSQFVMSVRGTIVLNVLTPTLVGPMLFVTPPPLCHSPPLVLPQGGPGDRHLVNPKRAKPPPKGAVQSIPVESGEHVQ